MILTSPTTVTLISFSVLLLSLFSPALLHRCNPSRVIIINPPTLADPLQFSYSHIALDTHTRVAHIAGQVAYDASAQLVGDTLAEQLAATERNVRLAMEAVGALNEDILRVNAYIKDFNQDTDLAVFQQLGANLGSPVSTLVGVPSLALDTLLVEIELDVAVHRKKVRELRCEEK